MPDSEDKSIPLSTAKDWTKNWRDVMDDGNWLSSHMKKAFLIPMETITNLQNKVAKNIRVYFGVDKEESDPGKQLKLVIVGVDADGKDMLDESQGEKTYDFARPCPPLCDDDSDLN